MVSTVREMLAKKVWAVVGVSADRSKFGYKVYKRLLEAGYTVYAINPKFGELEGRQVYPELSSLPEVPDVVNCVVPPAVTAAIVPLCAQQGIKYLWFQPGAECDEALELANNHSLVAECACVLVELRRR
ncbi:MAG: CoA-binding protein [Dethiobacter sp.]|jgi:predicted CoA-binding protein|nr:CoA-binding protein [Dethiobacter sp.]MBS3983871.1 CoA-binding protein [Dethiobacter sp.]MCL4462690.1 CoA-binding protein [Bacillota bacterium]MCL5993803.1 CoA-binding protein [Bacillota bacterium]